MSSAIPEEQATPILTELRGQSIVLPDLNAILGSWPSGVHQDLGRLPCDVDERLDRYDVNNRPPEGFFFYQTPLASPLRLDFVSTMSHSSKLETLKAADFAYFGATWWPRARYERLRIVTFLAIWVGVFHIAVKDDLS